MVCPSCRVLAVLDCRCCRPPLVFAIVLFCFAACGGPRRRCASHLASWRSKRCSTSPPGGNQVDGLPPAPVKQQEIKLGYLPASGARIRPAIRHTTSGKIRKFKTWAEPRSSPGSPRSSREAPGHHPGIPQRPGPVQNVYFCEIRNVSA